MKKSSSSSSCTRCNHCDDRKDRKKSTFFTIRNKQDFENNSLYEVNPQVSSTYTTSLQNLVKELKRPVATSLFTPPSSFTEIRKERRKQNNKKTMEGIQKLFLFIDSPRISTTSLVNEFTQWTTKIHLMNKTMKKKLAEAMVKFFNERVITREENKHRVRDLYKELELLLLEIEDYVPLSKIHKKHAMFLIANGDVKQGMAMLLQKNEH